MESTAEVDGSMPELVRSIANRLREFVGNRRYAPRYSARLELSVSIINDKQGIAPESPLKLDGHTYDISSTGLAILMPAIRIGDRYLTGEGRTLLIKLKFPTGPIEIQGKPVRYERFEEDEAPSYIIGIHITANAELYRERFNEYLRTRRKG